MASTLVCFERYRSDINPARARWVEERPPLESPFRRNGGGPKRVLSERQLAHRRRMLEHLARRSGVAS